MFAVFRVDFKDGSDLKNSIMDDFELLEQIGQGAFGKVFRAKQTSTADILAAKVRLSFLHSKFSYAKGFF